VPEAESKDAEVEQDPGPLNNRAAALGLPRKWPYAARAERGKVFCMTPATWRKCIRQEFEDRWFHVTSRISREGHAPQGGRGPLLKKRISPQPLPIRGTPFAPGPPGDCPRNQNALFSASRRPTSATGSELVTSPTVSTRCTGRRSVRSKIPGSMPLGQRLVLSRYHGSPPVSPNC
jgi:hypothetical protein